VFLTDVVQPTLEVKIMLDLMLKALSVLFQVNLRNVHDVPFAMPLLMFPFLGFVISMIVLPFIGNKHDGDEEKS
jgi:hypothetical protein